MHPDTEIRSWHVTSEGTAVYVRDTHGRPQVWRDSELVVAGRR